MKTKRMIRDGERWVEFKGTAEEWEKLNRTRGLTSLQLAIKYIDGEWHIKVANYNQYRFVAEALFGARAHDFRSMGGNGLRTRVIRETNVFHIYNSATKEN